jgi:hypothetical protein
MINKTTPHENPPGHDNPPGREETMAVAAAGGERGDAPTRVGWAEEVLTPIGLGGLSIGYSRIM